jgi:glucokinase
MLLGIDLGATNVRVGRVHEGAVEALHEAPIDQSKDPNTLIQQMASLIELCWHPAIRSIGIGVPSVVDVERGIVYDVQNIPSWKEVHLKDIMEARFSVPTWVNNDANCFVLGERYYGQAKGKSNVIGLIIGTGFGAGVVLNGTLVSGTNCGAGEVGMLPYKGSILEHYCSGQFFERFFGETGDSVYKKAQNGDAEAIAKYTDYAHHISEGIKAVLYAYDPEIILLGGATASVWSYIEEKVWKGLERFAYPNSLTNLQIIPSALEHVAVLGAAALALDSTKQEP